jgi:hypothetical protein
MAGGGEGREVWEVLLRRFELFEFDLCRLSRGSMDSRVECRFASAS